MARAGFMGRLTASAMHEIQNVLAGVKESAGLLDDLLALSRNEAFPDKDKFRKTLSGIQDLVDRGTRLASEVNRLGHASQAEAAPVELGDVVRRTVFLAHRITQARRMTFVQAQAPRTVARLAPLEAMRALFLVMEGLTERLPQRSCVTVTEGIFQGRPALRLAWERAACGAPEGGPDPDQAHVLDLLKARGLPDGVDCLAQGQELVLTFPA